MRQLIASLISTFAANHPEAIHDRFCQQPEAICSFDIDPAFADPAVVQTLPTFDLVSPTAITIQAGESVELEVRIGSQDGCGDIDIHEMMWGVYGEDSDDNAWMLDVTTHAVTSQLYNVSTAVHSDDYATENMNIAQTYQMLYTWADDTLNLTQSAPFTVETIPADDHRAFRFTWNGSLYAPGGTTVTIHLTEITWTDVATGITYTADPQPYDEIVVTVTIQ